VKPATYPLEFYRNDTPGTVFILPGDRTTHTVLCQIRDGDEGSILADLSTRFISALEPAVGVEPAKTAFAVPALTPTEVTVILAAISPVYDFQLTAGADVRTYYRGPVSVTRDRSRTP
jgi:hypothetical protein